MDCPKCGARTRRGRIVLAQTWATQLVDPDDRVHTREVRFHPEGEEGFCRPKLAMADARHCTSCDTVVAPGVYEGSFDCFECGAAIPPEAAQCPGCGWSW